MSGKRVDELITTNLNLKEIFEKSKCIRLLNDIFLSCKRIPEEIRNNCRITNYTNNTVIFFATSSSWAAKARYMTETLVELFSNELSKHNSYSYVKITKIKIKVSQAG